MVDGQNSFTDYLNHVIIHNVREDFKEECSQSDEERIAFYVQFYTDTFLCAIKRWIIQDYAMDVETFTKRIKKCLFGISPELLLRYIDKEAKTKGAITVEITPK